MHLPTLGANVPSELSKIVVCGARRDAIASLELAEVTQIKDSRVVSPSIGTSSKLCTGMNQQGCALYDYDTTASASTSSLRKGGEFVLNVEFLCQHCKQKFLAAKKNTLCVSCEQQLCAQCQQMDKEIGASLLCSRCAAILTKLRNASHLKSFRGDLNRDNKLTECEIQCYKASACRVMNKKHNTVLVAIDRNRLKRPGDISDEIYQQRDEAEECEKQLNLIGACMCRMAAELRACHHAMEAKWKFLNTAVQSLRTVRSTKKQIFTACLSLEHQKREQEMQNLLLLERQKIQKEFGLAMDQVTVHRVVQSQKK